MKVTIKYLFVLHPIKKNGNLLIRFYPICKLYLKKKKRYILATPQTRQEKKGFTVDF